MLIKEYHILLPMSLTEYQVAQLYMIQVTSVLNEVVGACARWVWLKPWDQQGCVGGSQKLSRTEGCESGVAG